MDTAENKGKAAMSNQSECDKFIEFTRRVVSVPKEVIDQREKAYQAQRKNKRRGKR